MDKPSYNERYKAEVAKYTKKDGVFALCYFVYVCIVAYVFGVLGEAGVFIIAPFLNEAIFALVMVTPCFVIVLAKREGLSSIGIHKENLYYALLLGIIFAVISLMLYRGILPGFLQEWPLILSL